MLHEDVSESINYHASVYKSLCIHHWYRFDVVEQCWITVPDERPAFSELVNKLSADLGAIAGYLELSAALVSCKEEQNTAEHDRHKELNEVPCVQNLTAAVDSNINPATLGTQ